MLRRIFKLIKLAKSDVLATLTNKTQFLLKYPKKKKAEITVSVVQLERQDAPMDLQMMWVGGGLERFERSGSVGLPVDRAPISSGGGGAGKPLLCVF